MKIWIQQGFRIQEQQKSVILLSSGKKHMGIKIKDEMACKSQKEGRNEEGGGEKDL